MPSYLILNNAAQYHYALVDAIKRLIGKPNVFAIKPAVEVTKVTTGTETTTLSRFFLVIALRLQSNNKPVANKRLILMGLLSLKPIA